LYKFFLRKGIEKLLIKFDLDARTVAGIEYKTREEAELAREEIIIFNKIIENKSLHSEDEAIEVQKSIKNANFKTKVADLKLVTTQHV